ncbi:MAG TPA: hypothetical protein VEA61_04795 [Allosphingosinicella sp.]|nr:hypothetical protein [Allosphingosinicella sp.]
MTGYYALILDVDLEPGSNFVRIIDSDEELERLRAVHNWNPNASVGTIDRDRFTFQLVEDHPLENVDTGHPDPASIQRLTFNG